MRQPFPECVHFEVEFPDRGLVKPILDELARAPEVEVSLIRGRITRSSAWFELEISGTPVRIAEILALSRKWSRKVRPLDL